MDQRKKNTMIASILGILGLIISVSAYLRYKTVKTIQATKDLAAQSVGEPLFLDGLYSLQSDQYGYLNIDGSACSSHSCGNANSDLSFSSNFITRFKFNRIGTQNSGRIQCINGSTPDCYIVNCKTCESLETKDICLHTFFGSTLVLHTKQSDSTTYFIRTVDGMWLIPVSKPACSKTIVGLSDPSARPPANALGFRAKKVAG